jgi:hypothetical protein
MWTLSLLDCRTEGTTSFVNSWKDLLAVIASKAALNKL